MRPEEKIMKVSTSILCSLVMAWNIFLLTLDGVDPIIVCVALGGSISGSFLLIYFRRELTFAERLLKFVCSSIAGVLFGAVSHTYFEITKIPYIGANYAIVAMVSLFFIRALLMVSEKNCVDIVQAFIQRVFNLQTPGEKHKRYYRSGIAKTRDAGHFTHKDKDEGEN